MRLNGKNAIVTGSTKGIGLAIAKAYAREGARVVISSRNMADCQRVSEEIRQAGGQAIPIACDVSNYDSIQALYDQALKSLGSLDIVVNNAGILTFKPFLEADPEMVLDIWHTNLFGTFFSGQRAAKEMIRQGHGGKIINMSSISEEVGTIDLCQYATTKGGIKVMTRCMALELAPYKINVNAIGPGVIDTGIDKGYMFQPGMPEATKARIPWNRMGVGDDVAGTAIFLATDDSEYITGTTIYVDGGLLAM